MSNISYLNRLGYVQMNILVNVADLHVIKQLEQ